MNKITELQKVRLLDDVVQGLKNGKYAPIIQAIKNIDKIPVLEPSDVGKYIRVNVTEDSEIIVPNNRNFIIGSTISFEQTGTGSLTITPTSGVTLNGNLTTNGQYSVIQIIKVAYDTWTVIGGIND